MQVNRIFDLICDLDRELAKIVDGSDKFILTVVVARRALRELKKFFYVGQPPSAVIDFTGCY